MLVGAPGSGKTLAVAKLADRAENEDAEYGEITSTPEAEDTPSPEPDEPVN